MRCPICNNETGEFHPRKEQDMCPDCANRFDDLKQKEIDKKLMELRK